jgi:hypothetical protein
MTTSLGDDKDKKLYNLKGANSYIIKPIKQELVHKIIQLQIDKLNKIKEEENNNKFLDFDLDDEFLDLDINNEFLDFDADDEFFDFDANDEFLDFEDDIDIDSQKKINHANTTHKHVSAKEFLDENLEDDEYFYDMIDSIDDIYDELKDSLILKKFTEKQADIGLVLSKYSAFLNTFSNFYELSYSIYNMSKIIDNLDLTNFDEKKTNKIIKYIEALFINLDRWKTDVFINKTAVDVYYINASILNDIIYLEDMVKKL